MKYEQLANDIIKNVGGKENVNSVVHCITRLRFKLKDESAAQTEVLKNMDGVVTVMKSGGQYQVVIGNHVPDVYKDVVEIGGFQNASSNGEAEESSDGNLLNRFIDVIASIFTPVLGVLVATGMIKGLNALLLSLGWLTEESGTYMILNAVGDSLFYFFPVFLGYTAIKKFGGSPFIGMAIGAALVYPGIVALSSGEALYTLFAGTLFESPVYIEFLGIPVILMTYASSVIPIIIAAFFAAKIEKFLVRTVPDVVKVFVVPFATLLVIVPLTFMLIGPIATWAAGFVGLGVNAAFNLSPVVAGIIIGGLWQVFVIFGLHWGLVPLAINNLTTQGFDPVLAMMFAASFAQTGAVLGVWLKTKEQKVKTLSIPAFISGIFGVTEPAIYGITLPKKRPFVISCIAASVGGAILGLAGSSVYMVGGLGIFGIPSFIGPAGIGAAFWAMIVSIAVAFILGFVLTYLFGLKKEEETDSPSINPEKTNVVEVDSQTEAILSPLTGLVKALADIKDETFASGALGKGIAIEPTEGKVFAPASGIVTALFPTNHAIGISTDHGAELLIHVGMDTVQLDGKHFTAHVKQGDRIDAGQLLVEFDADKIREAGYLLTTPIIVTNHANYDLVLTTEAKAVGAKDTVMTLDVDGAVGLA